jgi:hypothetical protein
MPLIRAASGVHAAEFLSETYEIELSPEAAAAAADSAGTVCAALSKARAILDQAGGSDDPGLFLVKLANNRKGQR